MLPDGFDIRATETRRGKELTRTVETATGGLETVVGEWPQRLLEHSAEQSRQPTWVGYGRGRLREAGIAFENLFQHLGVFGTTGYGKSTVLQNLLYQWARGDHGFCFIDPKGDTAYDVLQSLPEARLADVIWIEPGADRDRTVGFNFLDVGFEPSHPQYDAAIEGLTEDLVALLRADRYWGARMDRVTQNMLRAMQRSKYEYTLLDVYFALASESSRQQFAALVDEEELPFIREYTRKIAQLSDSELEPLLGRFQPWVENPVTRQLLAHRESPINIANAVESGKLVIVRNATESTTIGQMIATAVMRRVWATIKARKRVPLADREPFFLVVDEFDAVVAPDADVERMLSKARAMRMSVTLCCQQPSQLPKATREAMFGNCDTLLTFRPGNPNDARQLAQRFGDLDADTINSTPQYQAWVRLALDEGKRTDPLRVQTFPAMVPQRDGQDVEQVIRESLDRYGNDRLDDKTIRSELRFDASTGRGSVVDSDGTRGGEQDVAALMLQSIYAQSIRVAREWMFVSEVNEAMKRRTNKPLEQSQLSNIRERLTGEYLDARRRDGRMQVRLTQTGQGWLFNTGTAASGGGDEHRFVLREAFEAFTAAGFDVTLPTQDGGELPDGIAALPIDPMKASTPQDVQRRLEQLETEYPVCATVSDGREVALEAETTTLSKPMQTLTNLRKAIEAGRRCVFVCKDGSAEHGDVAYWAKRGVSILTDPPCVSEVDGRSRTFYTTSTTLSVGEDGTAVRPQSNTRSEWVETDSGLINRDSGGSIHVQLGGVEDLDAVSPSDVEAYYTVDRASGEYAVECGDRTYRYSSIDEFEAEWGRVYEPFVPEREFPRDVRSEDFLFVVVPDSGSKYEELQVVVGGECTPLSEYGTDTDTTQDGYSDGEVEGLMAGMRPVSEGSSQDSCDGTSDDLIL
ncbi:AAA-like domain-containing protein [Halogranum gelatinilyticum]|uniref:AAA-like domain-containing protein n=1 Tax=Halogranum gelatinilyticum TaxID=660521 RepID=A0A1G9XAU1_9EURY|nr:AAA-like domain-containing protein [Halogranum gelatinilyticum]